LKDYREVVAEMCGAEKKMKISKRCKYKSSDRSCFR